MVGEYAPQELPIQARSIEIGADIGAGRKPVRLEGVVIFNALDDVLRFREAPDGACMIEMQMRLHDVTDILRIDVDHLQLIDAVLRDRHHRIIGIHDRAPMAALVDGGFHRVAAIDRAAIQLVYVPAARNASESVTELLKGRLWQAARWSDRLKGTAGRGAMLIQQRFEQEEPARFVIDRLRNRWQQLHEADTDTTPMLRLV